MKAMRLLLDATNVKSLDFANKLTVTDTYHIYIQSTYIKICRVSSREGFLGSYT